MKNHGEWPNGDWYNWERVSDGEIECILRKTEEWLNQVLGICLRYPNNVNFKRIIEILSPCPRGISVVRSQLFRTLLDGMREPWTSFGPEKELKQILREAIPKKDDPTSEVTVMKTIKPTKKPRTRKRIDNKRKKKNTKPKSNK